MAEEDLIFGKNRHLFGGIAPSDMLEFTSRRDNETNTVRIKAVLPKNTMVNGQNICSVEGAVIRRKTTGYPKDEFDGELVADIKSSMTFSDVETNSSEKCYYAAFPYSTQGVYNRNVKNRTRYNPIGYTYLYGFTIDETDPDPDTRVSYPSDVDNHLYAKAYMDYTNDIFVYGDWPSEPGIDFMPRPCMLNYDGTVHSYLDPNDYSKTIDGEPSQYNNPEFGGNAMMEWPKIYYKREFTSTMDDGATSYTFKCSDVQIDNTWWPICNINHKQPVNEIVDHFYTAIYFGSSIGDKLRSLSSSGALGSGNVNSVSKNAAQEITLATANGTSWYTNVFSDRMLITDLLIMISKSTDGQKAFGSGRSLGTNTEAVQPGTMDQKGMFWGDNGGVNGVKVFGMEHWWGNLWRRMAGLILNNGVYKYKRTRGSWTGSTPKDYNLDGAGYETLDNYSVSGTTGNYISKVAYTPGGRFPISTTGGSSTIYYCDGFRFDLGGIRYPLVGGHFNRGVAVGPFNVYLNYSVSATHSTRGAALSCKPIF